MNKKIHSIDIVPAIYLKNREDGNVLLKCLQGNTTVIRAFDPDIIKNIENPKYIFLGIITGVGEIRLTVCDGNDYEHDFKTKWNILLN